MTCSVQIDPQDLMRIACGCLWQICGAAPRALKNGEYLVVTDLQIALSACDERGRVRTLQHVLTILSLFDAQADTKACVGPDLVVDGGSRFLRGEDQVQPHAAAHARGAHQLVDE